MADPKGSGAGNRPQFALRIVRASSQNFSFLEAARSMRSAASLRTDEALRKASSFPPVTSRALKACTD